MSGIKYYTLKSGESMPVEFAVVENVHGEPEIRAFYERSDELRAENAKLRELVRWMYDYMDESCAVQYPYAPAPISYDRLMKAQARARELGVEVPS